MNLEKLRRIVEKICSKANCVYAILFGSYANGKIKDYSDIDLAVYFSDVKNDYVDTALNLAFKLEEALGRKVDVIPLNIADSIIKYEVFTHGILLYCTNHTKYFDDHVNAIDEYLDFKPCFERFYRKNLRELKNATTRS